MHETKWIKQTKAVGKAGTSRSDALIVAAQSQTGTVSAVMDQLAPGTSPDDMTKDEKPILQGIAHGGEGYGNEYGSGPGVANADASQAVPSAEPGDSASPAASAMTKMRKEPAQQRDSSKYPRD
jgi:hypothetical protein